MSALPALPIEETELQQEFHKIASHPKLANWLKLFLDRTNKNTYGNKTQSAIQAYNLDPVVQYFVAASIGYQNFKKLQILANAYYEKEGMTTAKVLDLIAALATQGKPKALEMLASLVGVYDPKTIINIQNNTQINANVQLSAQEIETARRDFDEFIEAKYKNSEVVDASSS